MVNRIKYTVWYRRWKRFMQLLQKEDVDQRAIINYVYGMIEDCRGHGSNTIACGSYKAKELVLEEAGYK